VYVTITDTLENPYNITVQGIDVGGGDYLYRVFFNNVPLTATDVVIGYSGDGGITWTDATLPLVSPAEFTLPNTTQYEWRLRFEPDGLWYYVNEDTDIELILDDDPVRISVIDNDEDKFTPIRSKQAEIRLHTDNQININTFTGGGDNRYYVEIAINSLSSVIFSGWLSIQDMQQDFQPHPNVLILVATDGLGFLRDLPLTDYDGEDFEGENKIIDYIAGALKKTGLDLPIVAEMNIREADYAPFSDTVSFSATNTILVPNGRDYYPGQKLKFSGTASNDGVYTIVSVASIIFAQALTVVENVATEGPVTAGIEYYDGHFYNTIYLDAKTFEADINEFEKCYEVLEKIFAENVTLFQQNNRWYIKRIDEVDQQDSLRHLFTSSGAFDSVLDEVDLKKEIGADASTYTLAFMNQDAVVSATRPHKFVRHEFIYDNPKEIPCNKAFIRGDYISDLSATEKKYELDCWTLYQDRPNVLSTTAEAYIYKKFDTNDYEIEKYAIIGVASATIEQNLVSQFIEVQQSDKFDFSFQVKYDGQVETSSGTITGNYAQVRLYADDSTYYTLDGGLASTGRETEWVQCTSDFDTNQQYFSIQFDGTDDDTEWRSVGFSGGDCPPIPKTGKIQLVFCHQIKVNQFQLHISDVEFNYIPFINGSYKQFTGQYHKSEQTGDYKGSRTKQVYISDSPKRILKGALLKYNGSRYVLTEGFYNHVVFPGGPPSQDYIHPFGEIQNQDVWNQYRRRFFAFEGTLDGLDTDKTFESLPDLPDLHHYYLIKDTSPMTDNKKFVLLHTEQNLRLCETSVYLVEAYDSLESKDYLGHEFKYIESERN
jgi:hypothetical protein